MGIGQVYEFEKTGRIEPENTQAGAGAIQPLGPNQEKWLVAIESGAFIQGTLYLCKEDKYCCLGIGCVIFENIKKKKNKTDLYKFGDEEGIYGAPKELIDILNLFTCYGDREDHLTNIKYKNNRLSFLNDSGRSFSEIAELIRSNPAAYFRSPK